MFGVKLNRSLNQGCFLAGCAEKIDFFCFFDTLLMFWNFFIRFGSFFVYCYEANLSAKKTEKKAPTWFSKSK